MITKDQITAEMMSATDFIEAAAHLWQKDFSDAKPACFLASCAKFVAESFYSVSDEAFEVFLQQMRETRADRRKRTT